MSKEQDYTDAIEHLVKKLFPNTDGAKRARSTSVTYDLSDPKVKKEFKRVHKKFAKGLKVAEQNLIERGLLFT